MSNDPQITRIGEYVLQRKLGEGGMALTFLAQRMVAGTVKACVIKIPKSTHTVNKLEREWFQRETEIAMRVRNPNVLGAFDAGEHDGTPYYVMEFIAGCNLLDFILALAERGQVLPSALAAHIMREVAQGIEYLQTMMVNNQHAGIIHGDVASKNVMLGPNGEALLIDFGIARSDEDRSTAHLKGSLPYMAPELFDGKLSPAIDVYGLGAIAWEMCSLVPFRSHIPRAQMRKSVMGGEVPAVLWKTPPDSNLDQLIHRCLHPDPSRRATISEVLVALKDYPHGRIPLKARILELFGNEARRSGLTEAHFQADPELRRSLAVNAASKAVEGKGLLVEDSSIPADAFAKAGAPAVKPAPTRRSGLPSSRPFADPKSPAPDAAPSEDGVAVPRQRDGSSSVQPQVVVGWPAAGSDAPVHAEPSLAPPSLIEPLALGMQGRGSTVPEMPAAATRPQGEAARARSNTPATEVLPPMEPPAGRQGALPVAGSDRKLETPVPPALAFVPRVAPPSFAQAPAGYETAQDSRADRTGGWATPTDAFGTTVVSGRAPIKLLVAGFTLALVSAGGVAAFVLGAFDQDLDPGDEVKVAASTAPSEAPRTLTPEANEEPRIPALAEATQPQAPPSPSPAAVAPASVPGVQPIQSDPTEAPAKSDPAVPMAPTPSEPTSERPPAAEPVKAAAEPRSAPAPAKPVVKVPLRAELAVEVSGGFIQLNGKTYRLEEMKALELKIPAGPLKAKWRFADKGSWVGKKSFSLDPSKAYILILGKTGPVIFDQR